MKNIVKSLAGVAFGSLATLFIAGCGTVGMIDADRDSVTELPGRSDMYLVERKVRVMKSNADYISRMLTRLDGVRYEAEISQIANDSKVLRQLTDQLFVDMQELVFKLEEQDRVRIKESDDRILARMRSLVIPSIEFKPPQTLKNAAIFFRKAALNPVSGDPIDIDFDFDGIGMDWRDEWKDDDRCGPDDDEDPDWYVYKQLPLITASDINLYEALSLVCESVEGRWNLRDGVICVEPKEPKEESFYDGTYPAPLNSPDRDWEDWLTKNGIHLPSGSKIIYDKVGMRIHVTTTRRGFAEFENGFPLIYSGN